MNSIPNSTMYVPYAPRSLALRANIICAACRRVHSHAQSSGSCARPEQFIYIFFTTFSTLCCPRVHDNGSHSIRGGQGIRGGSHGSSGVDPPLGRSLKGLLLLLRGLRGHLAPRISGGRSSICGGGGTNSSDDRLFRLLLLGLLFSTFSAWFLLLCTLSWCE